MFYLIPLAWAFIFAMRAFVLVTTVSSSQMALTLSLDIVACAHLEKLGSF